MKNTLKNKIMNDYITSLTGKYTVNILLIAVFSGLAITGIFFMEGGRGTEGANCFTYHTVV
jgi:hypothetical protein